MAGTKVVGRFVAAVGAVAFLACGGETPGITDPPVDTTDAPVDTAAANAAARTAATNVLLTQINDALSAISQAQGAGGGGPTGSTNGGGVVAGSSASLANTPPPPPADAAKCNFDSTNTRWACPDHTHQNGLVVKSWFQFLDADNKPHKHIDTSKTVAIRRFAGTTGVVSTQLGTQQGPVPATDTLNDADTLLLSGLKGPPNQRKVTSSGTLQRVLVPTGLAVARISAIKTTEDVRLEPPGPKGEPPTRRYPISGKITVVLTSEQVGVPNSQATTTQVTSYDGTAVAKLVITSKQGVVIRTCTYDMTAQNTPPSCK